MNSRQRIQAAIALEATDRVPVAPWLGLFAASYTGLSKEEFIFSSDKRFAAVLRTAVELGPWDMTYMGENASEALLLAVPARVHWPGRDLPADVVHQVEEFELLGPEDYALLQRVGLLRFLREVARRLYPEINVVQGLSLLCSYIWKLRRQAGELRAAGIEPAAGFMHPGPLFEYFSIGRSLATMLRDLYDRPQAIKAAGGIWAGAMTRMAIRWAGLVGVNRVFVPVARASPAFISPAHFEEFVYPDLKTIVGMLIESNITPVLHCDTGWKGRLEVFKRFRAGTCIIEFDGDTSMAEAKRVLGGHTCIKGNVPASLTAFGQRCEVLDYCRGLIEKAGKGGGFILSTGCTVPANAKVDNIRAIYEAAQKWGHY
ncbi:MAG: hypothetical protein EA384_09725 [Spirochaetaceae bacterium]|nr:MAG: hypothetical protein EA384_09725 [Spirochaetaceae bacterium]